ncbi:MAG: phosphatidylglycerol lysyltransferase domain-containing protein [Muribaculaceae bacterium]|nr:phosphatidylglycerol lysyltransferase domain-containing protein [Muribaculaceae bacterium]
MENAWNFSPAVAGNNVTEAIFDMARKVQSLKQEDITPEIGEFKKITHADMPVVWKYLANEKGRTTDFSYGGVLMWVDFFNYEYAIYKDTLFIKGVVENDMSKPAFSLPVGALPLSESIDLLKDYCKAKNLELEFSAVPEYALQEMKQLNPVVVEELKDWGDYLYNAAPLATVAGKKMSKKRNHVHQFEKNCDEWHSEWLTPDNADKAYAFMDIFDLEGDSTDMAAAERELSRKLILRMKEGDSNLEGMLLYADGKVCAYTIGDVKGDTLFVHVEKATRNVNSSYEMINYVFAKAMCEKHPEIQYINREDDAGDMGLRMAKESYHPVEILKKYNIIF